MNILKTAFLMTVMMGGGMSKLFSTHPTVEERIKRLREIAAGIG